MFNRLGIGAFPCGKSQYVGGVCCYDVGSLVVLFGTKGLRAFLKVKMASVLLLMCGLSVVTSVTHMLVMDFGSSSELLRWH